MFRNCSKDFILTRCRDMFINLKAWSKCVSVNCRQFALTMTAWVPRSYCSLLNTSTTTATLSSISNITICSRLRGSSRVSTTCLFVIILTRSIRADLCAMHVSRFMATCTNLYSAIIWISLITPTDIAKPAFFRSTIRKIQAKISRFSKDNNQWK